ncbi:FecR domain-containing protein [candidate division KSB1 bacterium]|nr:FecR domain-containing protein [candidate division KSB1 bacterium]
MRYVMICLIIVCLLTLTGMTGEQGKDIAIVLKATGQVQLKQANAASFTKAERGEHVNSGDVIQTGADGFAAVMFTDDKSLIKVRQNSTLTISGNREQSTIAKRLNFPVGEMWLKVSKQNSELKVETPSGVAAVKGTEFYTIVDNKGNTTLHGIEGKVELQNELGEVFVTKGTTGLVTKEKPPTKHNSAEVEIPTWGTDDKTEYELGIEFEDGSGHKKKLKIEYDDR